MNNQILQHNLESVNNELQSVKKELQSVNEELQSMKTILKKHFGPSQIRHIMNPGKTYRWTSEEIASAISLTSGFTKKT